MQSDIKKILEIVAPALKKTEVIDTHAEILDRHDLRLSVTEQAIKQHVTNKRIHLDG